MQVLTDAHFRHVLDSLPLGVTIKDRKGRIIYSNPADAALHGYAAPELVGRPAGLFGLRAARTTIAGTLEAVEPPLETPWQRGSWNSKKSGDSFPVQLRSNPVHDSTGNLIGVVTTCEDISERDRIEGKLGRRVLQDPLTNLANRAFLVELVTHAGERAARHTDSHFAVLYVNLLRFRVINESLGHDAGDRVLIETARRLKDAIRPTDVAARIAGDEFAIFLDGLAAATDAHRVVERVLERFDHPIVVGDQQIHVDACIGVAGSKPGCEAEQYFLDAQAAMNRAQAEDAPVAVFDAEVHHRAVRRLQLETDLRAAIHASQLRAVYQPIIDLSTGAPVGFEALVRWGDRMPKEFIPAAEETGLVIPLGTWMLQAACRQLVEWRERFPHYPNLTMHVNLSVRHLRRADVVEQVSRMLAETRLPADRLKLEVTETMLMANADAQVAILKKLLDIGVGVAIDDFGTGYSSLSYLQRFPIDALKIDRSFVPFEKDSDSWQIVRMIINLARDKKAVAIAEGVEAGMQNDMLRELGCDRAQGYLYGRPLEAEAVEQILAPA